MTENSTFDFQLTLQRLSGDERTAEAAFKELYDHFAPKLYTKAKHILESHPLAEDLVQEVFCAVWLQRKKLEHVDNLECYLHGIVKRMAFALLKRTMNAGRYEQNHLERLQSQNDTFKEEYARQVEQLIEKLPSPRKEIFISSKIEGMDGKQIAERFKISYDAVRQHISRALKFINENKRNILSLLFGVSSLS